MTARWTPNEDQALRTAVDQVIRSDPIRLPSLDGGNHDVLAGQIAAKDVGGWTLVKDGRNIWEVVAESMPGRTARSCLARFRKLDHGYTCSSSGIRWLYMTV
jgi:hypothetical protein